MKSQRLARAVAGAVPTSSEVGAHVSLVRAMAAKLARRLPQHLPLGDLEAAGIAGVFDALCKRGDRSGPAFEGYLRLRIRGAMIDELRAQDWMSRGARKELTAKPERFTGARVVALDALSEEARASLTDGVSLPVDDLATERDHEAVASAVASLPTRERVVITLHYLHELDITSIAAELGVSVARTSQLRARAIRSLRSVLVDVRPSPASVPARRGGPTLVAQFSQR